MCIYCGTNKYRKIYENHYGPIPKDNLGRTFEIHHVDGNRKNNNPNNLIALSIQDHYQIHFEQNDLMACYRIASKMKVSSEILSNLSRNYQKKLVESKKHHFLGGDQSRKNARKLLAENRHPFKGGKIQSETNIKRINRGEHNSQTKICCLFCHKVVDLPNFKRSHGDNCFTLIGKKNYPNISKSTSGKKHPKYDHTIYTFVHKTGIIEMCTRNELLKKYDLTESLLWCLIKGIQKSTKGWSIAHTTNEHPNS